MSYRSLLGSFIFESRRFFVRYIMRASVHSTPNSSPIKNDASRNLVLDLFHEPVDQGAFDLVVGPLVNEDYLEKDMEMIDPPDII